ncbi:choice-of-anchor D domain-containing protein [Akkermansiaceae bacterium]|nr:choice-of-anchor D domain-containing protein [Akkermansiaceae bacterium]
MEVDGAAFELVDLPPGVVIAPNGSISFEVRFDPTSAGIKNGSVSVFSNDANESTYTFDLRGEGLGTPEIDVRGSQNGFAPWVTILDGDTSPRESDGTDFGVGSVGGPVVTKTFQIVNTGDAQLTIDSITEGNQNFAIAGVPATVGVNQTQTFTINFDPQSVGIKTTTVTIQNNDANEDPYTFSVTGEGRAPEMKVRGQTHIVINGDTTPSTTNGTDFGQIAAAAAGGISREFFIHNEGNLDLFVSAILQSSSAFTITDTPNFAAPITPGNSASFTILFNPTSAGLKTSTVTIRSNDPANDPHTFAIEGEGLGTAEILVQGQLNGTWTEILDGDPSPGASDGTDFANVSVGGSGKTRTFRIRNTGDAQLTIDSITDGSPHFSVASIPSVVGVNQTKTFTITFAPTSTGTKNATITIQNNDPNEDPYTFHITGTGRAPDIEVTGQGLVINN